MEWKEVTLGEISSKIGDGLHGTPKYDDEGPYYFINGNNLNCGKIIIKDDTKRVGIDEFVKNQKELNAQTLLVSINGTIGNVAKYNNEPCILGKSACYINVIKEVDKEFIYYVLTSANFKRNITNEATGTTIKNVSLKQMREYKFNIPCNIADQRRIASILTSLDRKIELNNKINADLEEMAQAIFKNWFVDFEPFKDGKFVDSELGMIPEGWKVGCLGDIAEITSGKRPPKKSKDKTKELFIPLIGASDIMGFTSDVLYERPILVIGRVGTHGVVQRFQEKCWPSDNTLVIESRYYNYVYQLLKGIDYSAINRGSTQPLITQTDVKNTDVIIAPENVLKEYESITSTLFSKHRANIKDNSRLSTLRDTLLPRLMSGELEVPK